MNPIQHSTKPRLFKRSKNKIPHNQKTKLPQDSSTPKKRPHFPSIHRIITDLPRRSPPMADGGGSLKQYVNLKNGILLVLILLGLVWNMWVGIQFFKSFSSWSSLLFQREKLIEQMDLWENITKAYPNYRDAYVRGEIYAYMLENKAKEQYFLQKLQLLDPNFPITKSFEELEKLQLVTDN